MKNWFIQDFRANSTWFKSGSLFTITHFIKRNKCSLQNKCIFSLQQHTTNRDSGWIRNPTQIIPYPNTGKHRTRGLAKCLYTLNLWKTGQNSLVSEFFWQNGRNFVGTNHSKPWLLSQDFEWRTSFEYQTKKFGFWMF